ncbi:hypothetical protein MNEG_5769 [Monoraphidium neglectum]|uniref:Uncharacterized protein n=1 Tax=Monoraphidium neglectum TaxID=145388 RepID=A0A0D2MGI9_9CHLO|nr:hypothetical protein MNEG_5769 [Monoraphidium neglectum]KIZ02190.1 hypothetical protein MNEG_5769 [Monoraphidium neglectum]|eukprot:XP_013901209.1 hypothetical protein MNEG_5769 [Monoraphidium neglectum]
MEVLKGALIKRMRAKFAEIISAEVTAFMEYAGGMRVRPSSRSGDSSSSSSRRIALVSPEQDLSSLEDRIRAKLTGGTPQRSTLAAMKRAQQEADEWAKIYEMHIKEGKAKDTAERAAALEAARALQIELAGQVAMREAGEAREHDEEVAYFHEEQAQLKRWEREEEEKARLKREVAARLKADRAAQLADRDMRRRLAEEKRAAEECELAARLAHEAKAEFEREEAARREAKEALKAFLLNNEIYKAMKEEAKLKEWEFDKKVMAEYAVEMERQERRRQEQLEALKIWQAKQEKEAQARPEAKRWIDPALIDRYYVEAEEARAAEEERRQAALKASGKVLARDLDIQVEERRRRHEEEKKAEQSVVAELQQQVTAEQARRQKELAAERAKKQQLRLLRKVVAMGLDRTGTLAAAARAGTVKAQAAATGGGGKLASGAAAAGSVPSTHSGGAVSGDTSGDAPDDGARTVTSDAALAGPGPAGPVSDTAGPKWSQQMHSLDCVIRNRGLIETADVETLWQAAHALLSHAGPSARAGGADAAAGAAPAGARRRVTEKGRVGALEAEVAEKTAQIKELQLRIAALAMRESVLTDLACLTAEAAPAMGGARPPFSAPQQRGDGGGSSSGTGSGGDGGDGGGGGVAAAEEAAAMADASLASPSVLSGPIREALAAIWADTALQERVKRMTTEEYLRRTQDTVMELALHLTHCKDDPEAMARLEATARRHRLEE